MTDFGSRTGFVGSVLDGDEGLLVLRGAQDGDVAPRVAEHLRTLLVAGARHVRVDARGASGLGADLLPVLGRIQTRLNLRRGVLTVSGLRLDAVARVAAA
ncbi:MAG TPA: hypothetical protein VGH76_21350 [Actinomycetospora sp.]|jgi:hypothetical protein|uniref:hypothetical protein n=1 Tax=Actinomycetospora sp. TaxID=1872135 RepID=UPI002F3EF900